MKLDGLTHPKTKELAYTLGIPLPHAIGLLELLWAFVGQQTPQGNVGKWSNPVLAGEAGWNDCPDKFIEALVSVGFLDEHPDHRLLVHDWQEHAPNWVHAKLKKKNKRILSADLSSDLRQGQDPTLEGATNEVKCSEVKPNEAKGKTGAKTAPTPLRKNEVSRPDDIDEQTWSDFLAHRRQKKAKLTPTAWKAIRKQLDIGAAKGHDPNDMLAVAMAAGWQGFEFEWFANRVGKSKPTGDDARNDAVAAAKAYRRART